jgi:uncharacterized protein YjiK
MPLHCRESWKLPGNELSGLGLRNRGRANEELLAVGDKSFRVFSGGTHKEAGASRSRRLDDAVKDYPHGDGSQWEGIAADGSGRIYVLQEYPGYVFVFDFACQRLVGAVSLDVPDTGAEWETAWHKHVNACAETFVLLEGGRILVIKQKCPVVFIEFGQPQDDTARHLFLAHGDDFGLPAKLEPRHTWLLDEAAAEQVTSVSDAAVLDGVLYVLSAKSHCIAQMQPLPADGSTVGIEREPWTLPATITQPEGLVILPTTREPIVAADLKSDNPADNVFRLDALPA